MLFTRNIAAMRMLSALCFFAFVTLPALADDAAELSACSALARLRLPDTDINSATLEKTGIFSMSGGMPGAMPGTTPGARSNPRLPQNTGALPPGGMAPAEGGTPPMAVGAAPVQGGNPSAQSDRPPMSGSPAQRSGPAGAMPPPGGDSSSIELPAYCKVKATVKDSIEMEVWLPADNWNGRFQGVGNGGTAGFISYTTMAAALHRGYAVAGTNTGHVNQPPNIIFDAKWALNHPALVDDWGYLAIHLMTTTSLEIIRAYYNVSPTHSYFVGCSRGGGQALTEAQKYPGDYDGIIAGDPANDNTNLYAGSHLWFSIATLKDPASYIPSNKVSILANAVTKQCDEIDGVKDGIISDPPKCKVALEPITCKQGEPQDKCLTPKQVQAVKDIWSGVRDASGKQVFPGLVPGSEAGTAGWAQWITGWAPKTSLHFQAADEFYKYVVFDNPSYDPFSFNFGSDLERERTKLHARIDAVDPDLRPFIQRGGKLILYHGWSDPDISPLNTINYYTAVEKTVGAGTSDSVRLFMVPGMNHCEGGPGPNHFDALTSLEEWVQDGVAPSKMLAFHLDGTTVDMSRPLCPYPQVATFSGKGSPSDALNFSCLDPK